MVSNAKCEETFFIRNVFPNAEINAELRMAKDGRKP